MSQERRRYFRINDFISLAYEVLEPKDNAEPVHEPALDVLDLMSEQDEKIERLLLEVAEKNPQVAALVRALNQKLERVTRLLAAESRTVERLARRVREVNLSACGIGFLNDTEIREGARLALELELPSGDIPIKTHGLVVAVEPHNKGYYWRVDFYGMAPEQQERLIQYIVQRQSVQLKGMRQIV